MFRQSKLVLVALIAAAPFALAASASAKPLIDPGFNGPKFYPKPYPFPKPWPYPHWRPRPVIVVEQPIISQPVISQPVVRNVTRVVSQPSQPAPQTTNCLTKDYSPDGIVTFKDLCTKETASAALPGSPAALQQQGVTQGTAPQGVAPVTQNQTLNTNAQQMSAQANVQPTVKN